MPERATVLVFSATLNVTLPLPLPLDPAVTEIHPSLAVAVQPHSFVVVTLIDEFVLPDAATDMVVGVTPYEQVGPATAACVTATLLPAMRSVPVRSAPVFATAVNETEPGPEPLAPDVMLSHDALEVALHVHPAVVSTEIGPPAPPLVSTDAVVGLTVNEHVGSVGGTVGSVVGGRAGAELESCVKVTLRPAIVTDAERSPPLLAATVSVTEPGPVPVAPAVMVTHDSSAFDVQAQPASVSTVIRVLPPAAPTFCPAGDTLNWQDAAS